MLLASHVKDMNAEELFGIIKPFLFLVPLVIVIILAVIAFKIYQSLAVKRMIKYMETKGLSEADKRTYLTTFLMRASQKDLIHHERSCSVCGKKYSLKIEKENSRGDVVEEWNHDGCTHCGTKVYLKPEENHLRYFAIKRNPTNAPKEKQWQKIYNKVEGYIDYYKPYVDCTPDSSGNKITIDINFY